MRRLYLFALLLVTALPTAGLAQQRPKLQVADVRVGFPAGFVAEAGEKRDLFKAVSWTPVYVDVQAGPDGLRGTEGRIDIVVETLDCDDVMTSYTVSVALDKLGPNEQFTVVTYTKPAATNSDVIVNLVHSGQQVGQTFKKTFGGVDASNALYLAVGSRLVGLRQAMRGENPQGFRFEEHVAYLDTLPQMPQQWFGYDGVDLLLLSTSNREFITQFDAADERYRRALAEWVHRGGHLVVSVGRNADAVAASPELQKLLPVKVGKAEPQTGVTLAWEEGNAAALPALPARAPLTVTTLERKPGVEVRALMRQVDGKNNRDLIVQGGAGLGRVTVVAFDLDQPPVSEWGGQAPFYKYLVAHAWPRQGVLGTRENPDNQNFNMGFGGDGQNQLLSQLYSYLENFEEVPVISFAWVALFIFLYILVVGPLDYFFLKKVVKRMELTWITFPTVVLTISALAYFTAYWIKGKDLRIRKVDVVDLDLTAPQPHMAGRTWFTLFSPRIQHYTIAVEPSPVDWAPDAKLAGPVTISWLGRPDTGAMNTRTRGQSLFRRTYDFEAGATSLGGVPIQVWSTKSFTASWQAPVDPKRALVSAELAVPGRERSNLEGAVTWLPGNPGTDPSLNIADGYLIYQNRVTKLALKAGQATKVNTARDATKLELSVWFRNTLGAPPPVNNNINFRGGYPPPTNTASVDYPIRAAMFFDAVDRGAGNDRNIGLRELDQSWRLQRPGEAVLLLRLPEQKGDANVVNRHLASASRLWLGSLPAPGAEPELDGILRQDTFLRVFVPVAKQADK